MFTAHEFVHGAGHVDEVRHPAADGAPVRIVSNARVFPPLVQQFTLGLDAARPEAVVRALDGLRLPAELQRAVARRQAHFLAGRYCAMRALRAFEDVRGCHPLSVGRGGAPAWPDGVVGSITHTDGLAAAVVARTSETGGLGLDTERVIDAERARRVATAVAWPVELAHGREAGLDRLEALTLAFAAKEAIFKSLYAEVGFVFGFHDVRLAAVDGAARLFQVRLVKTLVPSLPCDTLIEGRFEVEGSLIHAGVTRPPASAL